MCALRKKGRGMMERENHSEGLDLCEGCELAQAERAGRFAILPCKPGDVLYVRTREDGPVEEWRVLHPSVTYSVRGIINHIPTGVLAGEMGKTVFFSRPEV